MGNELDWEADFDWEAYRELLDRKGKRLYGGEPAVGWQKGDERHIWNPYTYNRKGRFFHLEITQELVGPRLKVAEWCLRNKVLAYDAEVMAAHMKAKWLSRLDDAGWRLVRGYARDEMMMSGHAHWGVSPLKVIAGGNWYEVFLSEEDVAEKGDLLALAVSHLRRDLPRIQCFYVLHEMRG